MNRPVNGFLVILTVFLVLALMLIFLQAMIAIELTKVTG